MQSLTGVDLSPLIKNTSAVVEFTTGNADDVPAASSSTQTQISTPKEGKNKKHQKPKERYRIQRLPADSPSNALPNLRVVHRNQLLRNPIVLLSVERVFDGDEYTAGEQHGAKQSSNADADAHVVRSRAPQQPPAKFMKYVLQPIGTSTVFDAVGKVREQPSFSSSSSAKEPPSEGKQKRKKHSEASSSSTTPAVKKLKAKATDKKSKSKP